ncbi:hypothetical protein TNCV_4126021 [Trichonephila clavipes]|nr:hypothetical protein TNCV_4126021 [Trichonephila clavipes]
MDVCKCIVPWRHGGTLNSRRAASPLVWLVERVERTNDNYDNDDELNNNTVNTFHSLSPPPTDTAYPSEIISYIKKSNSKKAPGKDGISNRINANQCGYSSPTPQVLFQKSTGVVFLDIQKALDG